MLIKMSVIGRFAPSPTGRNAPGQCPHRPARLAAQPRPGGRHLLRFEDLDTGRVRAWAYELIRRDLEWLGLDWDQEYHTVRPSAHLRPAFDHLATYPCTCTRREIAAAIQAAPERRTAANWCTRAPAPRGAGRLPRPRRPPPGAGGCPPRRCVCRALTGADLCQHLPSAVGDFVLKRNDGVFAYHLAVVVDDA